MRHDQLAAMRVIDASLNRAGEGLRVVEDYARFSLDDRFLTHTIKQLRHDFAEAASLVNRADRLAARDTQADVGATVTTDAESHRGDAWQVCLASFERVKQSLRSLEEFGKVISTTFAFKMEGLRYRTYTLEKALDTTQRSHHQLAKASLCVLIDGGEDETSFGSLVGPLVDAGVGMLQLRDKQLDDRVLIERARLLVDATRETPTIAIVNDRPDIAAAAAADGVHLGQDDMTVKDARSVLGPRAIVGVSTHGVEQARQAVLDGANYLGAGPTFPSQTKSFDAFPGTDYLRQLAEEITLPTFAIGGIDAKNVEQVIDAGVRRIAVSSAVTSVSDPAKAVKELIEALSVADH